ncbi:MAG: hypothetical protein AABW56_00060 [Nanoarchaeota archaeon]
MSKTKMLNQKDKLDMIREHFYYEVFMLIGIRNYLVDYFTGRNQLFVIHQNIIINSILLHSRNLLEFFYYPKDKNNNYARAKDFVSNWDKVVIKKIASLIELEKRTSNECLHLTYNRIAGVEHRKWDLISTSNDLLILVKLFLDNLPKEYFDGRLTQLHNNLKSIGERKKFEKFIIGINEKGKEIKFTCDESKLANLFGANPNAPNFLTRIFFKKEVLDKYYGKPSKYSIKDGYLLYTREDGVNEWGIPMDNNAEECVVVYLGDLGKLPNEEQKHWKLHNITNGMASAVSFVRDYQAEFCSPTEPALFFKERFEIFNGSWKKKFGWDLFKPLNKEDEHHIKTLRIPNDEQKEFDEIVLSLNKIIIDSLNVEEMKKNLNFDESDKSISILQKYLEQKHKINVPQMIEFLRDLQNLRSSGIAHRKGDNYKKAYKKFDKGSLSKSFEDILIKSIMMLNTIENGVLKDEK